MSGLFSTLNTANKGLFASQTSLHTSGHNISNANTKGFNRQRVETKASLAYNLGGVGQLGTGVMMDSITRVVDDYVVKQIRNEMGTMEMYSAKSEVIDQLEVIFNEPSTTGLNFYLGEMFDSWQELSKNPESLNSKTVVVEKARALADTINQMSNQISSLRDETVGQLGKDAMDFNAIVDKLDALNKQIFNIGVTGKVPNDLLDQRDLMLQDLGQISNIDASFDKYGRASISIGDNKILGGEDLQELSVISNIVERDGNSFLVISRGGDSLNNSVELQVDNPADYKVGDVLFTSKAEVDLTLDGIKPSKDIIKSGKIQGNTEALDDIKRSLDSLNKFAKGMAKAINAIHTDGNTTGYNFFSLDESNPGSTIKVNDQILQDHSRVWVGKNTDSPAGDGSRALAIARLRNTNLDFTGLDSDLGYDSETMSLESKAGGITIEGAYGNIVTNIGMSKEHADNIIANQEVLVGQLEMRRESTSGVSIDEEITNVVKYQKAYEANARVIQVLTEMLDVLINRTGV